MGEKRTLEVGEKYLTISLLNQIKVVAFRNKNKDKDNTQAPDFVGAGVAVWINTKKEVKSEEEVI